MSTTDDTNATRRGSGSNDLLGAAAQQCSGMPTTDEMAAERYRVARTAFWWRVKIGDGQQTVGRCHTEAEAERLASALRTAFLDGAFVVAQQVAEEQRLRTANVRAQALPEGEACRQSPAATS